MKYIKYPSKEELPELLTRPHFDNSSLRGTVDNYRCSYCIQDADGVLADIRKRGDAAVKEYELKFDKVELASLAVTADEIKEAEALVDNELKSAIIKAKDNIAKFHAAQDQALPSVETMPGVKCWQKAKPIEKVGLYIPGGTAPLFSTVLMLATPAKIAGCKEIVLCTPPDRQGRVNPR